MTVYELINSETSRKNYYEIIKARIDGTIFPDLEVTGDQYFHFRPFKIKNKEEVFVDCGVYVGDTIEEYLFCKAGVFKDIYAIEPDERNLKCLSKRINRLKQEWCTSDSHIEIIKGAIGNENKGIGINNSRESISTKCTFNNTDSNVKMYKLDDLFLDKKVGFIKADVEGHEYEMLEGGRKTIKEMNPLLAICIYHKTSDLFKIALLIKEYNRDYQFEIAHHYYDYNETILYGWCER